MSSELATWLIDTGDIVIEKRVAEGEASLSVADLAVYNMWLIDYAVNNSGSFGPLEDMDSTALSDLSEIAQKAKLLKLAAWLEISADESLFCDTYDERFDAVCAELKDFYSRHDDTAKR